jgi:hypothetical protein
MRLPLVLSLCAASCAASAQPRAPDTSPNFFPEVATDRQDAVEAGRARALKDIAAGDPQLLFAGLPSREFSPLDSETGLRRVNTGCCVDAASASFEKGYNETTIAEARAGRAATYRDRLTTREALAARFASRGVVELTPSHPSIDAPGGQVRFELAPYHYSFDPPEETTPYVIAVDVATGRRTPLQYVGEMRARVAFGDGDRTLLMRDDAYGSYYTFDVATLRWLQHFPDVTTMELFESELPK